MLFIVWHSIFLSSFSETSYTLVMNICIIYHSESGNTRHVVQHLASACDGCLIEVSDQASYMKLTRFLVWCKKIRGKEKTEIKPAVIDMEEYDLRVFGSPVRVFKPTPPIHTAIDCFKGMRR